MRAAAQGSAAFLLLGLALAGGLFGYAFSYTNILQGEYGGLCYLPDDNAFNGFISEGRAAVMFSSENCPTCKELEPYWLKLCKEGVGDAKVAIIKLSPDTLDSFVSNGVEGTPTFILYVDGEERGRWVGKFNGDQMEAMRNFIQGDAESLQAAQEPREVTQITSLSEEEKHKSLLGIELPIIAVLASFASGMLAALSPCVFPVLVSYVSSLVSSGRKFGRASIIISPFTAALGALAMGGLFLALGAYFPWIGSAFLAAAGVLLFGAGLLELSGIPTHISMALRMKGGLPTFSFLYGLLAVQCSLPLVTGALFIIASGGLGYGVYALIAFATGIALPVLAAILASNFNMSEKILTSRLSALVLKIGYAMMVAGGAFMLFYGFGLV
ncbi:MAG: thioredoxin domain-containing protein [Aeropyrum sp.]|nr:thioredoxin domain-containing protein [Aeropyrum sp.]